MPRIGLASVIAAACLCASGFTLADNAPSKNVSLNATVLDLLAEYPEQGFGGYTWPAERGTHGTTRDLYHRKTRIARAGSGNHCVGITFEVMWRAVSSVPGAKKRLTAKQARRLRTLWFVPVNGGAGPADALPTLGLGQQIHDWEKARPGDFIQLWNRDATFGHSAVFLDWLRDEQATIVGVKYWSSQPWTGGIGVAESSIGDNDADMDPKSVFIARLMVKRQSSAQPLLSREKGYSAGNH